MDAAAELGRDPVSHQIQPAYGDEQAGRGTERLPKPFRETKFSGANNADREISKFPVQLTTCRIDSLTRLVRTLAIVAIHAGAPRATRVSLFFPFVYLEMSLFPSIFCTISASSLYGEYVVRSFLPDGVFLLWDHSLDF